VVKLQGLAAVPAASTFPAKSVAAIVIVAVYSVVAARFADGVKVAMSLAGSYVTVPVTVVPPVPATANVKVPAAKMLAGFIASLNVALTAALSATPVAPLAGLVSVIVGGVVSTPAPVIKLHGLGTAPAASALPDRSVAAFVIVAVYDPLAARFADGVNVTVAPAYVTVPGTAAPPTPATATVNVPGAVIVAGSIASLNVAEII